MRRLRAGRLALLLGPALLLTPALLAGVVAGLRGRRRGGLAPALLRLLGLLTGLVRRLRRLLAGGGILSPALLPVLLAGGVAALRRLLAALLLRSLLALVFRAILPVGGLLPVGLLAALRVLLGRLPWLHSGLLHLPVLRARRRRERAPDPTRSPGSRCTCPNCPPP